MVDYIATSPGWIQIVSIDVMVVVAVAAGWITLKLLRREAAGHAIRPPGVLLAQKIETASNGGATQRLFSYDPAQERLRERYLNAKKTSASSHASTSHKDFMRELQRLTALSQLTPGQRILDLGCGLGQWTVYLAKDGFDAYGVDLDPDFIDQGRLKAQEAGVNVNFTCAPAERLPFEDGFFSGIICNYALEHVADWKGTLREIGRVLGPGGVAYLSTNCIFCPVSKEVRIPLFPYYPGWLKRKVLKFAVARFPALVNYSPTPAANWFTPSGLKRAFREAGFDEVYDIFDFLEPGSLKGVKKLIGPFLPLLKRVTFVRNFVYIVYPALRIYAVKGRNVSTLEKGEG